MGEVCASQLLGVVDPLVRENFLVPDVLKVSSSNLLLLLHRESSFFLQKLNNTEAERDELVHHPKQLVQYLVRSR